MIFKKRNCVYCNETYKPTNSSKKYCSTVCVFWSKVNKCGVDECWNWIAATSKQGGYGVFGGGKTRKKAHRFSFELHNGPIPIGSGYHGMCVIHSCDNPSCVNPKHLFLGTQTDNIKDMFAKNRRPNPIGEKNPSAKLKDGEVLAIRKELKNGKTYVFLADKYNVSPSAIGRIKKFSFILIQFVFGLLHSRYRLFVHNQVIRLLSA